MKRTINDRKYDVKKFPNVGYVFWLLNPILSINELVLGQRIPKETLVELDVERTSPPKEYVECKACGQLTDLDLWPRAGVKFRNWFGLACPTCGSKLPTCLNLWSRLLLLAFFPIVKTLNVRFQNRVLSKQVLALRSAQLGQNPARNSWKGIKLGVLFGGAMAVLLSLASLAELGNIIPAMIIGLVGGSLSGLLFSGLMYLFRHKI